MIQYISWKHVKVTGKKMRLYLSMSEAVMPNILFRSFMSQSGLGGGCPGASVCTGTPGAVGFWRGSGGVGRVGMAAVVGGGGGTIGGGSGCGGGIGGPM